MSIKTLKEGGFEGGEKETEMKIPQKKQLTQVEQDVEEKIQDPVDKV